MGKRIAKIGKHLRNLGAGRGFTQVKGHGRSVPQRTARAHPTDDPAVIVEMATSTDTEGTDEDADFQATEKAVAVELLRAKMECAQDLIAEFGAIADLHTKVQYDDLIDWNKLKQESDAFALSEDDRTAFSKSAKEGVETALKAVGVAQDALTETRLEQAAKENLSNDDRYGIEPPDTDRDDIDYIDRRFLINNLEVELDASPTALPLVDPKDETASGDDRAFALGYEEGMSVLASAYDSRDGKTIDRAFDSAEVLLRELDVGEGELSFDRHSENLRQNSLEWNDDDDDAYSYSDCYELTDAIHFGIDQSVVATLNNAAYQYAAHEVANAKLGNRYITHPRFRFTRDKQS